MLAVLLSWEVGQKSLSLPVYPAHLLQYTDLIFSSSSTVTAFQDRKTAILVEPFLGFFFLTFEGERSSHRDYVCGLPFLESLRETTVEEARPWSEERTFALTVFRPP